MVKECPICLELLSSPWVVCSPCGHALHDDCRKQLIDNGRGWICVECSASVDKYIRTYVDFDEVEQIRSELDERNEQNRQLEEEVARQQDRYLKALASAYVLEGKNCILGMMVCRGEVEVAQVRSELNERNEKNRQLEEEVARLRKHLEVKNKVIEKEKRLRKKGVAKSLVSVIADEKNDVGKRQDQ